VLYCRCQTEARAQGKAREIEQKRSSIQQGIRQLKRAVRQDAYRAVAAAEKSGQLIRQKTCSLPDCSDTFLVAAHHYLGYAPEHRLDVQWLCSRHHARLHRHPEDNPIFYARLSSGNPTH
jgi:hypothetical protein